MESEIPDYEGALVGGRYRVEKLLGQGAMGSVWSGRHQALGQLVAIKFIHPRFSKSEHARKRFATEAKALTLIKSRHAVAVHDCGLTQSGEPYIVMDYLEGESLEQALERRGRLPLNETLRIVSQAALGLQAAHDAGVIHRDLKPDNIFLAVDPEETVFGYSVKIVDFGIAKIAHQELAEVAETQAGALLGTPFYMSPEALAGFAPVSVRSDIWALGASAFAAACGRPPFEGQSLGDVVLRVCSVPLPVPTQHNPALPKAFDTWFATACARQPESRFRTPREMAEALERIGQPPSHHQPDQAYEIVARERDLLEFPLDVESARPSSKGRMLAGALVGAALTLGVLGYYVRARTRAAEALAQEAAGKAAAIIEADNHRKLDALPKPLNTKVPSRATETGKSPSGVPGPSASPPRSRTPSR